MAISLPQPALDTTISLVARARQGDRAALELIAAQFHSGLMRFAHGRIPAYARGLVETHDIVQQAVAALRGSVVVESAPGFGTEVRIEVPEQMATLAVAVARTPSHVLALSIRGIEQLLPADGLASNVVHAIAVAPDGALWFGTEGGVSRYLPAGGE